MNQLRPADAATLAQRRAAQPETSVWVSASAGTGKTKVLTDRVLTLLLENTPPHKILCLTFTRAAAAEMANRINKSLSEWAVADDQTLSDEIEKLSGDTPDAAQLARARMLFRQVLETPGGMKIQTLHSFCESLLGRFPLEAGLAPHFAAMDDQEAQQAHAEARARVISSASDEEEGDLRAAIDRLAALLNEDQFAEMMLKLSSERGRLQRLVDRHDGLDGAVAEVYRRMEVARDETRHSILAEFADEAGFDGAALRAAAKAMIDWQTATDQKMGAELAKWLAADQAGRIAGFDSYKQIFLTAKEEPRKNLCTSKLGKAQPETLETLTAELPRVQAAVRKLHALITAEATAALLVIGDALNDQFEGWKRRHGRLDYDDLVLHARALLKRDGGVSWVLFKLDGGIDHILIDEAQDTNPDQWDVVSALAEEFFVGDTARESERTVFAVGDAKQSIYSFQRADPGAFEAMRTRFREQAQQVERNWDDVSLDVSFRSTAPVLRLVDEVFSTEDAADGVIEAGETLRHVPHREGHAGLVELWPLIEAEKPEDDPDWTPPVYRRRDAAPAALLAKAIADRIKRWLDSNEILESQNRPIEPGDIMILVRRRGAFVHHLVRELKSANIEVAGVDRMVLGQQLAVQDLLALGQFLLLPEDDLTLATVLKGPLFGLTDDDLITLCPQREERTLWQELRRRAGDDPRFQSVVDELSDLLGRADFVPPFELFADVLARRRGRRKIVGRLGHDAQDPIDEFLNRALNFGQSQPAALQSFIQAMAADTQDVKRDLDQGQRNEVRIMTVHGSKGLQAPIVFLPDTISIPPTPSGVFWDDDDLPLWPPVSENAVGACGRARAAAIRREQEEYRRLLYVALTRAEDRLYVCGWTTLQKPREGNWYELVAAAMQRLSDPVEFDLGEFSTAGWAGTGYRIESRQTDEPQKSVSTGRSFGEPSALPDWAQRPPPPEKSPPSPLIPSRPDDDEPPANSPMSGTGQARFRRGLIVHRLLQTLPDLAPDQRAPAARRYLARKIHGLAQDAQDALWDEVALILEHPEYGAIFGEGSRAEVPVTGRIGDHVISGQVDRLLVSDDRVLVVDFKTNRPPPEEAARVAPVYLRQMAAYRAVLRQIWPDRAVECALLWTAAPDLMPLPAELLDRWSPA